MDRQRLNDIYRKLDQKARELNTLFHCTVGYYNGHYRKGESGEYEMDYFPIPEVTVKGLCDIEIELDGISITTKLSRDSALSYDYDKIKAHSFEAYGVENYLNDFYTDGSAIEAMLESMEISNEKNIFFSFRFPFEAPSVDIYEFADFLRKEGFFY